MAVPYTFSTASQSIPLAQLDSNFATPITLGQTTAALGQTVTTITGLTLANVNITSGNVVANASGNITFGNTTVGLGNSSSSIGNLTLINANVSTGVIGSNVTATTQTLTDNSAKIATTGFIKSQKFGLGISGETWHDVSGSRAFNTNYTNSNTYPISVCVSCVFASAASITGVVSGANIIFSGFHAATEQGNISFIVPSGATYQVTSVGSLSSVLWTELY